MSHNNIYKTSNSSYFDIKLYKVYPVYTFGTKSKHNKHRYFQTEMELLRKIQ